MAKYLYTETTDTTEQDRGYSYRTTTAGRGTKVHLHWGPGNGIICGSSNRTGYHSSSQEVTCTKCLNFLDEKLEAQELIRLD